MKILLVDDDPWIIDMWLDIVDGRPGVEVITVGNARDAEAILAGEQITILICDGQFPLREGGVNKDSAGESVMRYATDRGVPQIVSVSSNEDSREAAINGGYATAQCGKDAVIDLLITL